MSDFSLLILLAQFPHFIQWWVFCLFVLGFVLFCFFVVLFVCFFLFSFLRCSQEFRKGEWHTSRFEIGILSMDFCGGFFCLFFNGNMSYPQSIIYKV